MATKQQRAQEKYADFINLVEGVAAELYTKKEWLAAEEKGSPLHLEHFSMLEEVYSLAFERNPDAFKTIQWIDSEYGLPAWVRPGVEWQAA
jgi:hypothetical protein